MRQPSIRLQPVGRREGDDDEGEGSERESDGVFCSFCPRTHFQCRSSCAACQILAETSKHSGVLPDGSSVVVAVRVESGNSGNCNRKATNR